MVYEGNSVSNLTLSSTWKSISLSDFALIGLTPKAEISNPASVVYKMKCYGGGIPTGANMTSMSANWRDDNIDVQTAPSLAYSSLSLAPAPPATASIAFDTKRFNT